MKNNYLRFTFISNGIFVFAGTLIAPIFAIYLSQFTPDIAMISLVASAFMVSTGFFLIILAKVGGKIKNHSKYFVIGFLIRTITWFSFIFVTDIWHIIFLQIFLGLGEAVGSTIFEVIVAEHLNDGKEVEDYATWKLIQSISAAAAAAMGGIIAEFYGFQMIFMIMTALSIVSAVVFYLGVRKRKTISPL